MTNPKQAPESVPVNLLPKLCAEIIEWQDVGILPHDNEFYKFAATLTHIPESNRHRVAESMIARSAMALAARLNQSVKDAEPDSVITEVYMICDRYESGYGHGLKGDGLDLSKTPHADPKHGEAYQIGYEAGYEKFLAHPPTQSAPVRIPDEYAVVPRKANSQILARVPGQTADDASKAYERIVSCAEVHDPFPIQVSAFSCNQLSNGGTQCEQWCRGPDTCVASYKVMLPSPVWCGSLENWWAQATDEQKKDAYAVMIDSDHWKAKRIRELEESAPEGLADKLEALLKDAPPRPWFQCDEKHYLHYSTDGTLPVNQKEPWKYPVVGRFDYGEGAMALIEYIGNNAPAIIAALRQSPKAGVKS